MNPRLAQVARERPAEAMALATAASRATGFARTLGLAWALGVSSLGDAYNVANTAPNMLFQLAAGGVLSSAVVPLLTQSADEAERRENAHVLFGAVVAVGAVASLLLAIGAPWVVRALTAGAAGRGDRESVVQVSALWLRLFAPQVLAYAVSVFAVGVLTSRRRLFAGAAAPIVTNLVTLLGIIAFVIVDQRRPDVSTVTRSGVYWLGLATTAGVVAMAALQLVAAGRVEPGLRPRIVLRHPAIRRAAGIAPWVALYVAVNQAGLAIVVALASSVPGGVSAYQWAFAVMQLPHALIGVSIVTAAFPRISEAAVLGPDETAQVVSSSLRRLVTLMIPAAAGLVGLAPVIAVAIVGEEGRALVAAGIAGFAVSLVPFSTFQLLTRTSYAFRDARNPALVNIAVNGVNVAVNAVVFAVADEPGVRVAGFALGHAASYVAGSLLLARRLARVHGVRVGLPSGAAPKAVAAAAVAAVVGALTSVAPVPSQVVAGSALVLVGAAVVAVVYVRRRRHTSVPARDA